MKDIKVAFVIGHYSGDKGAVTVTGHSEYDFWNTFYIGHLSDLGDKYTHPSMDNSYTSRQTRTAERTADYDLVFELHFNASGSPQANGVEALVYHKNRKMAKVGEFFCKSMEVMMCYKNRGVKKRVEGQTGYGFLQKTKGDAILLEPFFGSNKSDCELFDKDEFSKVIRNTIDYYKTL